MAETSEHAARFIEALHALEQAEGSAEAERDALVALFSEDTTLVNSALRLTGESRTGREGAQHFWGDYKRTVGKAHSEFRHTLTGDGAAGLFWTTRLADGASYDGVTLLTFDGSGRIASFQGYYDLQQFNRALGVESK